MSANPSKKLTENTASVPPKPKFKVVQAAHPAARVAPQSADKVASKSVKPAQQPLVHKPASSKAQKSGTKADKPVQAVSTHSKSKSASHGSIKQKKDNDIDNLFAATKKNTAVKAPKIKGEATAVSKPDDDDDEDDHGDDDDDDDDNDDEEEAEQDSEEDDREITQDDIDALFAGKKRKKIETVVETSEKATKTSSSKDDEFFDSRGLKNSKRKKVDGLFVYKVDELGLDKAGGNTDLCPFDCQCCF